jgi:hypothetical protein
MMRVCCIVARFECPNTIFLYGGQFGYSAFPWDSPSMSYGREPRWNYCKAVSMSYGREPRWNYCKAVGFLEAGSEEISNDPVIPPVVLMAGG